MNNADQLYPSPGAPKTRMTDEPRLFEVQSDEDLFRFSAPLRAYAEALPDGPRAYDSQKVAAGAFRAMLALETRVRACAFVATAIPDEAVAVTKRKVGDARKQTTRATLSKTRTSERTPPESSIRKL